MQDVAPVIRDAQRSDVAAIVRLLADDFLGEQREMPEQPLAENYYSAFEAIREDPNNELLIAELGSEIVGVMQLTFMPSLTYGGAWRAQIEGVRVAATCRRKGIGKQLVQSAVARSRERQCRLLQLTTDKSRPDARAFYERMGFRPSHDGMKMDLMDRDGAGA